LFRLFGGVLNTINAGIGMVVFTLVLLAYPIFDWLARWVAGSGVLASLLNIFNFVHAMLPEAFHNAATMVNAI